MPGRLGTGYKPAIANAIAGSGRLAAFPATFYVALYTVAPSASGTGGTEVSTGAYARAAVPNDDANWPVATAGIKSNALQILFPLATANWGSIVAVALRSALTAGEVVVSGLLVTPFAISAGQRAAFYPGALVITVS